MPYVAREHRARLDEGGRPESVGQLNYVLSHMLNAWIQRHGLSYDTINELVGVLECAKLELYRRVAFYEDEKMKANGDVYRLPVGKP
jgi:hypothetical protein